MKREFGVTEYPAKARTETMEVRVGPNPVNGQWPFPPKSGRRMRYVIGIRAYSTDDYVSKAGVTTVQLASCRMTLRDHEGTVLVKDTPLGALRITPGEKMRVYDRLPVDFDKSWITTSDASIDNFVPVEFLFSE